MNDQRYSVARPGDIEQLRGGWSPIRGHFGIEAFGVNSWTSAAPGETVVNDHEEENSGHEELYVVVEGRATFTVDGREIDAPAGTLVFVGDAGDAEESRRGRARRPPCWPSARSPARRTDRSAGSGRPKPFRSSGAASRSVRTSSWPRRTPSTRMLPAVLYNLACAEALLGKSDEAVEHLRRAVELYPGYAEYARKDTDFDSIRDHPGFAA